MILSLTFLKHLLLLGWFSILYRSVLLVQMERSVVQMFSGPHLAGGTSGFYETLQKGMDAKMILFPVNDLIDHL